MVSALVMGTTLVLYLTGAVLQSTINVSILSKLDYRDKPGLALIVSLGFPDILASVNMALATASSAVGRHLMSPAVVGYLNASTWACGCLHISLLALNRLLGIMFVQKYHLYFSFSRTCCMACFCWFFSFSYGIALELLAYPLTWNLELCFASYDFARNVSTFAPAVFTVTAVLELGAMIWPMSAYVVLAIYLASVKRSTNHSMANQSSWSLGLCWQFFVISSGCWLNNIGFNVFHLFAARGMAMQFTIFMIYVTMFFYTLNPYVYLIFNKTIRGAVKEIIGINHSVAPQQQVQHVAPIQEEHRL